MGYDFSFALLKFTLSKAPRKHNLIVTMRVPTNDGIVVDEAFLHFSP
jgi:hypothetical protein